MADTKKEYTSNLHPKGDLDTTVYPNVKSENIIDKDMTAYTAGKVPDSSLVSKSLDGLNEKIETNKIQTDTNKTNIATLQGDVSSLKQDNQTTKTSIAGLVSDNTQNKKDIATLKANYTEVQSQANTNSSDIALLKTNAINTDTDASLKSLTLPSASDLKTKDGTSFGGGSKLYNETEYLPTFDIATLKDTYLPLTGGTMKGDINLNNNGIYFKYDGYNGRLGPISLAYPPKGNFLTTQNGYALSLNHCGKVFFNYRQLYLGFFDNSDSNTFVGIDQINGLILSSEANDGTIRLMSYDKLNKKVTHELKMSNTSVPTIDDSPIITQATLATDLGTKQSTLYRHTVLISAPVNKTAYLAFTAESEKNTTIVSIQDLITVFGHTSIACSGLYRDGDPANSQSLLMINVGTSISDTTISTATIENNAITDFSNALFTDTFGSTGFTITDNVTAM